MRRTCAVVLLAVTSFATCAGQPVPQSLSELARKEAERRQKVDQQGIPVKRIESANIGLPDPGGRVSVSSPEPPSTRPAGAATKAETRPTLRSFQLRLQKLDTEITLAEEKLKLLRKRADAARWTVVKTPKGSKVPGLFSGQDQYRWQILEAETKLASLRRERSDVFQAGRKAGYLPGELEGRGIR
jgi:hypothetical protein